MRERECHTARASIREVERTKWKLAKEENPFFSFAPYSFCFVPSFLRRLAFSASHAPCIMGSERGREEGEQAWQERRREWTRRRSTSFSPSRTSSSSSSSFSRMLSLLHHGMPCCRVFRSEGKEKKDAFSASLSLAKPEASLLFSYASPSLSAFWFPSSL